MSIYDIYINFCSKFPRAKVALALSRERKAIMPTITAIAPEPEPESKPTPIERAQMCALKRGITAAQKGKSLSAAFWAGLYRGLRR